jgi:hypothetical protein
MIEERITEEIKGYIEEFCSVNDRSVRIKIKDFDSEWQYGLQDKIERPAASLVKIVLAISIENLIKTNTVDGNQKISAGELTTFDSGPSILNAFGSNHLFSIIELLSLCLSVSDPIATNFLTTLLKATDLENSLALIRCENTNIKIIKNLESSAIVGTTSALDAIKILEFGSAAESYPITASGLQHSILNSRIPIGIEDFGTGLSHKTGTLLSVAHDVAIIQCQQGLITIAFLTENQSDTLQTGYEMGICTKRIIQSIGFTPRFSRSFD